MRNNTLHAKLLSLLLALVMVLSTAVVFAEGEEPQTGEEPQVESVETTEPEETQEPAEDAEPTRGVEAPKVDISGASTVYVDGKSIQLTATLSDAPEGATVDWEWVADDEGAYATVTKDEEDGSKATIKGVAAGTVNIKAKATVTVEGQEQPVEYESDSHAVTVVVVPTPTVKISAPGQVEAGKTITLTTTKTPNDAVVTYKSDKTNIATVDSKGVVKGVSAGQATITATATLKVGDVTKTATATCPVTVKAATFTTVAPALTAKKKYSSKDYEGAKDNGYILSWTQSNKTGVKYYQVLLDGKVLKNNIPTTTSKYEVLVPSGTHKYVIKAVGDNSKSISSAAKSIKISGVITATHAYTWHCVAKKSIKVTKTATGGGTVATVSKGTKMTAIGRYPAKIKKFKSPKKVKVRLSNGKVGWVPYKSLKGGVKGTYHVKQDYSRSLKEYMVNNKAFSKKNKEDSAIRGKAITSRDKYLIWACLYTQRAYTFQKKDGKWVLIHTDRITTGKFSHPTRSSETSGIYTVKKKKGGKVWMVQENGKRYYFTHASYITSGISFHTGTWWANGKHRGSVKASGAPGTYGCIRMYTGGAKYIFGKTTVGKTGVIVTRFD